MSAMIWPTKKSRHRNPGIWHGHYQWSLESFEKSYARFTYQHEIWLTRLWWWDPQKKSPEAKTKKSAKDVHFALNLPSEINFSILGNFCSILGNFCLNSAQKPFYLYIFGRGKFDQHDCQLQKDMKCTIFIAKRLICLVCPLSGHLILK